MWGKGEQASDREGGAEKGIINRKLSIPQHLRDRGIAVIRPRGRKLAGLWERKPRLEKAAVESEVEDCYCIQASVGQRGGVEGGRSTRGEPEERRGEEKHTWRTRREQKSRRPCEDQTAGLHRGTPALLATSQPRAAPDLLPGEAAAAFVGGCQSTSFL